MTIIDFQTKLQSKWPNMDSEDISFIGSLLDKYNEDDYERIYTEFRMTYQYSTPPKVAHINKAIESLGLAKSFKAFSAPMAYRCTDCGTVYSGKLDDLDADSCPNCFCRERSVVENPENRIGQIKTVQTMCICGYQDYYGGDKSIQAPICPHYGENRAYGPLCDVFETRTRVSAECKDCICAKCCDNRRRELLEMRADKRYGR